MPCRDLVVRRGIEAAAALVRTEGQRRLAERAWHAGAHVARSGWSGAWSLLLDRAVRATAGRRRETAEQHEAHLAAIDARLGVDPIAALIALARDDRPTALIEGCSRRGMARAARRRWGGTRR